MSKIKILTHRGLEPSKDKFFPESSYEAFEDQLSRGFGIEFDINFTSDEVIISHDSNLKRITNGKDNRSFSEITYDELKDVICSNSSIGTIPRFSQVMELIKNSHSLINAIHLKGKFQEIEKIDSIIRVLKKYKDIFDKILVFDVKPKVARYLKSNIPKIQIAPSVAHSYDIKRYNSYVGGTLISIEDAIKFKHEGLYDWVWLDEWDTISSSKGHKKFYTQKIFHKLREGGYKIALVTPELHGTSPGLLGKEFHSDARNKYILFKRIKDILLLNPDAVCTDWPEEVSKLL